MIAPGAGAGDDFIAGFLDDYFAESEEHLALVRRDLLALEESPESAARESPLLEELFRSFHSLKGLSAMVDVRPAERLAHELEGCLRALREGELALTADVLSVLIDSTAALESVIEARRTAGPPPDIERVVHRLASLAAGSRPGSPRPPREVTAGDAHDGPAPAALKVLRFTFVPSPSLVDRGVKVDLIRERLGSVGRITSVTPKVTSGGGIAFEFLVAGILDEGPLDRWLDDGLTWERVDPAAAPQAADGHPRSASAAAPEHAILAPSHLVRVDLKRLDEVMRRVADLVVTRARLDDALARVERVLPPQEWRALQENTLTLERQLRDLREDVMRVRLVRVDEIFRRMPFVARDVAREAGRDVRVVLSGQDTEIDKFLVERMMDPVLHVVRNAVSHGIESAADRAAAGKPPQGVISLSAATSGERVVLEIADDGAGIDTAAVAARARSSGVRVPDGPLEPRTLVDLISEAGFSTRREADRASGRGMGMAVVRTTVLELGGTLTVETEVGRGTRFIISLPVTLAITDALIAAVGGHRFAIPQSSVEEVIEIEAATVRQLENNELVPYRGRSLPLLRLGTLFDLRAAHASRLHAFVVGTGQDAVALGVDRIVGQREIVVRAMSDILLKKEGISGATELGDGHVVLILDVTALARRARVRVRHARAEHRAGEVPAGLHNGGVA